MSETQASRSTVTVAVVGGLRAGVRVRASVRPRRSTAASRARDLGRNVKLRRDYGDHVRFAFERDSELRGVSASASFFGLPVRVGISCSAARVCVCVRAGAGVCVRSFVRLRR